MRALVKNLEIRGKEQKTSQKGNDYLIIRVEDDTGLSYELYEPDIEKLEFYKKGQVADFYLKLSTYRKNWQVKVDSFTYTEED